MQPAPAAAACLQSIDKLGKIKKSDVIANTADRNPFSPSFSVNGRGLRPGVMAGDTVE